MGFEAMNVEQYRSLNAEELALRKAEVIAALEGDSSIDLEQVRSEVKTIEEEYERRNAAVSLHNMRAAAVAGGAGEVIERGSAEPAKAEPTDKFDTPEYRQAFMDFVCRGVAIPAEYRAVQSTATTDISAVIPTTLQNQIIEKLESYGEIYGAVQKLNVKGGIEFPVIDLQPTATWVGETQVSDYQKLLANEKVSFGYHELECRIAQSWLAQIVSFDEFQRRFVPAAVKAMTKKLDEGIISGSGTGQMLGIANDTRITNKVKMSPADMKDWKKWRSTIKHAIPREYRANGCYIMNQGTWDAYLETLADNSNAPVSIGYNPVTGNEEMRLMGSPVLITNQLPEFDDAANDKTFMIYGDLSKYAINCNQQMYTTQWQDPETRQHKTLAYMVADGKVLDPYGFVLIQKGAAA